MVVRYLDTIRIAIAPLETDTPLVVDANAVFPLAISVQLFEAIPRRYAEIGETRRRVEHPQLAQGDMLHVLCKRARPFAIEYALGFPIPE